MGPAGTPRPGPGQEFRVKFPSPTHISLPKIIRQRWNAASNNHPTDALNRLFAVLPRPLRIRETVMPPAIHLKENKSQANNPPQKKSDVKLPTDVVFFWNSQKNTPSGFGPVRVPRELRVAVGPAAAPPPQAEGAGGAAAADGGRPRGGGGHAAEARGGGGGGRPRGPRRCGGAASSFDGGGHGAGRASPPGLGRNPTDSQLAIQQCWPFGDHSARGRWWVQAPRCLFLQGCETLRRPEGPEGWGEVPHPYTVPHPGPDSRRERREEGGLGGLEGKGAG